MSPSAPMSQLRCDARRNRERVIEAAREALAEYGLAAQMDDIARRAGVGVGTVYRHFATKDQLVGELMRLKLTRFAALARKSLEEDGGDPWESFAALRAGPGRAGGPRRRAAACVLAGRPGGLRARPARDR